MRSRRKILDATLDLIASDGFEGVTIAAAAHGAGVTRQTVYSNFGSREELVSQAIAGLAVEVLGGIHSRSNATDTACEYVVELIVAGRAAVRAHPVLATLLQAERGNPVFDTGMMSRAKPVARELLAPLVERDPGVESSLDDIVEIALRLALSVVLFDDDAVHADDDLRRFLTRWLLPAMPSSS
ncbi:MULTISPECIES: TetR/AcrR family transcriptional regulator [Rhodococcus]|uniref:TetR family transcriptional regulator n=1 Tax=Rhodococcus opacus TaxID=37919 RepID=A0A076EM33_RHOOP|nr:TetR/AcrR family transcriptional regulator [Rhodococcus opacus]AII07210.1 TetR family transcriptional regulator [Rhodococcus opacus]